MQNPDDRLASARRAAVRVCRSHADAVRNAAEPQHPQSLPPAQHPRARTSSSMSREFDDRIAAQSHISTRRSARYEPDRLQPDAALRSSSDSRALRQGHLFAGNPLFEQVCRGARRRSTAHSTRRRASSFSGGSTTSTRSATSSRERASARCRITSRPAARIVVKVGSRPPRRRFYDAVTEFVRQQSGDVRELRDDHAAAPGCELDPCRA